MSKSRDEGLLEQVTNLNCPICDKSYKGKIGVGVHLKRSHTSEERAELYMRRITSIIPILITTLVILGVS